MGVKRTCTGYTKTKVGLRCSKFKKGSGHPVCWPGLVDGGRSPGLLRGKKCTTRVAKKTRKARKSRKSRK